MVVVPLRKEEFCGFFFRLAARFRNVCVGSDRSIVPFGISVFLRLMGRLECGRTGDLERDCDRLDTDGEREGDRDSSRLTLLPLGPTWSRREGRRLRRGAKSSS